MEVTVTTIFDVDTTETKKECVAKALRDVVERVLNKHFERGGRASVSFVTAEASSQ